MFDSMQPHDLERIRRSLAMSPSLPATVAHELLADIERQQGERAALGALAADLRRIADAIGDLVTPARSRRPG